MYNNAPKVLVVSHNVFSDTSNMGRTLANFFIDYPKDALAQIYFHSEIPTMDICYRYYRVTDFDMLRNTKKNTGIVLKKEDVRKDAESEKDSSSIQRMIYRFGSRFQTHLTRDMLWATNKWKNDRLYNWIDEFAPDIVFFASGDYTFAYRIAMDIAKHRDIPILTYVCDDYYFLDKRSLSPFYHINRIHFRKVMNELFSRHRNMIGICDTLSEEYAKEFGVKAYTIMTTSQLEGFEETNNENITISYIGNLEYKRYIALAEIGQALRKITDGKVMLDVYSGDSSSEILKKMTEENGINFRGRIPYSEVIEVMKKSDILIHTESMDKLYHEIVKYSVSTKIADTLAAGKCMLAYGPKEVASIKYLKDNDCAYVVTDKNELCDKLTKLINDRDMRMRYEKRALETAKERHNKEKNCQKIYDIITDIVRGEGK